MFIKMHVKEKELDPDSLFCVVEMLVLSCGSDGLCFIHTNRPKHYADLYSNSEFNRAGFNTRTDYLDSVAFDAGKYSQEGIYFSSEELPSSSDVFWEYVVVIEE